MNRQKTTRIEDERKDMDRRIREIKYAYEDSREKMEEEVKRWRDEYQ